VESFSEFGLSSVPKVKLLFDYVFEDCLLTGVFDIIQKLFSHLRRVLIEEFQCWVEFQLLKLKRDQFIHPFLEVSVSSDVFIQKKSLVSP